MQHAITGRILKIWRAYEHQLKKRPVPVQMTTSAILWGVGDCLAQRVAERRKTVDTSRVALTSAFGASFMGPVGHYWYLMLDKVCAQMLMPGTMPFLAAKVVADTFILGPIYVVAFYAWGSYLMDRTGWHGFTEKMTQDFIPTYCAELCIWPAFQCFNFTKTPVQHQLLAVNFMTLIDATFLAWARNQEDWVLTAQEFVTQKPNEERRSSNAAAKTAKAAKAAAAAAVAIKA